MTTIDTMPQLGSLPLPLQYVCLSLLVAALPVSIVIAIGFGHADIPPEEIWGIVCYHLGCIDRISTSPVRDGIVWDLRVPRVLTAALIGAALAICGSVMQALTRNPLADPYLLGLSSGASLGAVIVITAGAAALLPLAAFMGALLALVSTLLLAGAMGHLTPSRMILAGVAVSSLAAAVTSFVIFSSANGDSYREIISWLMGSLGSVQWSQAGLAATLLAVVAVPVMLASRSLDAFTLGESAAAALGINVSAVRWAMLAITALLTGAMVSIGGSIGFVGLVVPHAVRLVVNQGHRVTLPLSGLCGAILMVWVDVVGRSAFQPQELPVGVVTAMIGGPIFVLILLRSRRAAI